MRGVIVTPEKRVYTVEDLREILNVSESYVYKLIKSGEFRVVKVGRHYRIPKPAFDKWFNEKAN